MEIVRAKQYLPFVSFESIEAIRNDPRVESLEVVGFDNHFHKFKDDPVPSTIHIEITLKKVEE